MHSWQCRVKASTNCLLSSRLPVARQRAVVIRCSNSSRSMTAKAPMHVDVAVVGAGPAGLAAAAALHIADPSLSVHVFEKTMMTARGAAVLVGVNGLKALEAIGGGVLDKMLAGATTLEGTDRYSLSTGEHIDSIQMGQDKLKEKYGYHPALLGWSDITAALRSALPQDSITPSCPITAYEQLPDSTIQLFGSTAQTQHNNDPILTPQQQQDGQQQQQQGPVVATCKVLIGADGWFSPIRQQVLADGPPTFKESVVYRARIPCPDWMPKTRTKWWIPPGGPRQDDMLGVFIPLPDGDMVWQCHTPLRFMREKGVNFDPIKTEAASSHADNTSSNSDNNNSSSSRRNVKQRCLKTFEDFPKIFLDVVASTPESAITEHGLYQRTTDQIPDDSWGSGMVTLVGDAAHTAYIDGTGLGLALEDAAVLAWCVQHHGLTEEALRAFEKERIPRVKEVFGMAARHAAAMSAGVPQKDLLEERAQVLIGKAHFKPLKIKATAAAVTAG